MNTETMENPVTDESHNGWTNRETWACQAHLSNDQDLYRRCLEVAADTIEALAPSSGLFELSEEETRRCQSKTADGLKDLVEEHVGDVYLMPEIAAEWARSLAQDVGSLWRVDWDEIAEHWLDGAAEHIGWTLTRPAF